MRKIQKMCAALLAGVMTVGTFAPSVFADEAAKVGKEVAKEAVRVGKEAAKVGKEVAKAGLAGIKAGVAEGRKAYEENKNK